MSEKAKVVREDMADDEPNCNSHVNVCCTVLRNARPKLRSGNFPFRVQQDLVLCSNTAASICLVLNGCLKIVIVRGIEASAL